MRARRHRVARRAQRGRWAWWLAAVPVLAWVVWAALDSPPAVSQSVAEARAASKVPPRAEPAQPIRAPFSAAGLLARQAQRALWQQRLDRAQGALDAFRHSTRYPQGSRPLRELADQAHPNEPVTEEHPLGKAGKGLDGVNLRTTQERVFVQGQESVRFTVSLRDNAGQVLPLRVVRASARELPPPNRGSLYPELPLVFNDDGNAGDAVAGDGIYSTQLQPSAQGFADLFGQIRVEAVLQYRDQQGQTFFDIFFTPEAPASWQGGVREAMEDGSLSFYLPANVRKAGRYVVTARVDDANGAPFALLRFNDEVAQGPQEFRLTLFGKLVRDAKPVFPLTVRDVDGFLLHEDSFPDRSLMPRLPGKVHVSQDHPLASFSDAEWNADERTRYLSELSRDVVDAQAQVDRLSTGR
ncbi:MAG TPA: choice-of-anchor X domain-containing protein [Albitalea sp.]|nr:choice-of-anchor X domain-containing protein [Albitalea sp.]